MNRAEIGELKYFIESIVRWPAHFVTHDSDEPMVEFYDLHYPETFGNRWLGITLADERLEVRVDDTSERNPIWY